VVRDPQLPLDVNTEAHEDVVLELDIGLDCKRDQARWVDDPLSGRLTDKSIVARGP
jgi:hypothetical protein